MNILCKFRGFLQEFSDAGAVALSVVLKRRKLFLIIFQSSLQ